jgi:hypothetical protein
LKNERKRKISAKRWIFQRKPRPRRPTVAPDADKKTAAGMPRLSENQKR